MGVLDEIGKTADRIGLTTDALQELRAAAESAGIGTNTLDMAMQRFGRRVAEARMGTGEAKGVLKELGIELETATGSAVPLEDVLGQVADRMGTVAEQSDKNRIAMKLFDTEGVAMVNMLRAGSAGMAEMRENARALGIVVDESLIRGAEEAQTQLDLMSRVIDAQLNSALINLAPLLVGGATALADLSRLLATAANATMDFLNPQTDLEIATDNLVAALGDEIRQSQLLEVALQNGITLSVGVAKAKLQEAQSRYKNAAAAIAENRAMALASNEYSDLEMSIGTARDALRGLEGSTPGEPAGMMQAEEYNNTEDFLVRAEAKRAELLAIDEKLQAQLERSQKNAETLGVALENAGGGIVRVNGGTPVEPVAQGLLLDLGRDCHRQHPVRDPGAHHLRPADPVRCRDHSGFRYRLRLRRHRARHGPQPERESWIMRPVLRPLLLALAISTPAFAADGFKPLQIAANQGVGHVALAKAKATKSQTVLAALPITYGLAQVLLSGTSVDDTLQESLRGWKAGAISQA